MGKIDCKGFSVDYSPINTNDILGIHRYLMKETYYKKIFWNY